MAWWKLIKDNLSNLSSIAATAFGVNGTYQYVGSKISEISKIEENSSYLSQIERMKCLSEYHIETAKNLTGNAPISADAPILAIIYMLSGALFILGVAMYLEDLNQKPEQKNQIRQLIPNIVFKFVRVSATVFISATIFSFLLLRPSRTY